MARRFPRGGRRPPERAGLGQFHSRVPGGAEGRSGGRQAALLAAVTAARQAGLGDVLSEALSMASIAAALAGDHAAARRLLAEADVTAAGIAYPPGRISVLQARALNGSSTLIWTRSAPAPRRELGWPGKQATAMPWR